MLVGEYCTREVVVAPRDTDVAAAARSMRENHVGAVVVVDQDARGNYPLAIVTDRDLVMEVLAPGLDPSTFQVADLATAELLKVKQTDDLMSVLEQMRAHGVRRVPVVDDQGVLQGLLALDDILPILAEMINNLTVLMSREIDTEVVNRP